MHTILYIFSIFKSPSPYVVKTAENRQWVEYFIINFFDY